MALKPVLQYMQPVLEGFDGSGALLDTTIGLFGIVSFTYNRFEEKIMLASRAFLSTDLTTASGPLL